MRVNPLLLLPVAAFLGIALAFAMGLGRDPDALPSVFIDMPAPSVSAGEVMQGFAPLTDGLLASGKVTVVNFWASWCPPCRAENPTLLALAKEGINVVGVDMLDKAADARNFLAGDGNPYTALIADPRGELRINWGVTGPPETFIVRKNGTIAFKFIGPMIGDAFEKRFRPALDKVLAE